ncbi:MAG TPA: hypothetical protein VLY21_06915 [Nitrososphaerales archaeon]|nr:hypothetical protein [Nitrososphaerales archaeon]HUK74530.1 hypothetical protein [Nitrososphaerales archaeon]
MSAAFDKLYWMRLACGVLFGFAAESIFRLDVTDGALIGILGYLISYYIARFVWYRKLEQQFAMKLYTTAIGGYTMVFIFTWLLLFTISLVGV